ncbi:hypothetical protein [Flexivirga caeni]|uniref:Ankyrin repeat domain-containing protein n=1 Tax=Flexivirga caeni TaxID=2294115 RepID=A0A3M9MCD5_9MICO|nr:hypothetical protein [Flexivirga caeni]RNI22817.1 hypothetical protein EFY87_08345 [Flexivirga caeni]
MLDAGADPNDEQTLYNRMFDARDDHLVLLFGYGLGRDTNGPWHRLLGESLASPADLLRGLLAWAITHDQRARVALGAAHGVDITSRFAEVAPRRRYTPVGLARLHGRCEIAEQLVALGAAEARLGAPLRPSRRRRVARTLDATGRLTTQLPGAPLANRAAGLRHQPNAAGHGP